LFHEADPRVVVAPRTLRINKISARMSGISPNLGATQITVLLLLSLQCAPKK
jgi:hypothetical protein